MSKPSTTSTSARIQSFHLNFGSVVALLNVWAYRIRQRRILSELDDLVLRDIGVSRMDAMRESIKPFWQD